VAIDRGVSDKPKRSKSHLATVGWLFYALASACESPTRRATFCRCRTLLAVLYSPAYIDQSAERRLVKHGYEPERVKLMLHERYDREHADEIARYMKMYRQAAE
jgi:hypothetical protein